MDKTLNFRNSLLIFGVPLGIIGMMMLLAKSSVFNEHATYLSIGIIFDLVLIVPVTYFLLIRKSSIPRTTVVPFLIVGMVVCSIILPKENQYYLDLFKTWVFPVIELSIVTYVMYSVHKVIKRYRLKKSEDVDVYSALKSTCSEIFPKSVAILVVTEIAVFYYGFVYWKKRTLQENEFSYHKDSGTVALLAAIIFIIAIETFGLHILLQKWNTTVAWIVTFLSMYSGIQLLGFLKSLSKRPISIKEGKLYLRYGIMAETTVDIKNIDSIEISSKEIELNDETRKLSILGALESHNIIIRLKQENKWIGLYGMERKYKNIALYADNKNRFRDQIHNALKIMD